MQALFGVQTHYSFHWGPASPAAWFARAETLGYAYLGIADNAALHGLPEILRLAETSRVRPIHGAGFRSTDGRAVAAYVENPVGYGNLCQRISEWQALCADRPEPRAGGVPALSPERLRRQFAGKELTEGLVFIVDDPALWKILREAGVETYWRIGPTLAAPPRGVDPRTALFAPGPLLIEPDDFETHRLLRAVGGATTLDRIPAAPRFAGAGADAPLIMGRPGDILESPEGYAEKFSLYADAIERADALARRLAVFEPCREQVPAPVPEREGETGAAGEDPMGEQPLERLRRLAYEGAAIRYGKVTERERARLEYELGLIGRKGFAEYFLVVHDIVGRLAGGDGRVRRGRSITCGRGSGAASLVNYCLGVTNVDVLKHKLLFERFLNEARKDPPDIDVDFAWDERDGVLDKVFAEYGRGRVGRVANHNRYDWRGAFRAAARCLGFPDAEITRHLRESPSVYAEDSPPEDLSPSPSGDGALLPEPSRLDRKLGVLRRPRGSDWNRVERLCRRLVDIPHCLSMHCGGVVVTPGALCRTVPVVTSRKGQPTIQWEKDGTEDMGLVKIDLLGNRSLAVIRDAVREISRDEGIPEDRIIQGDPSDDPATRDLVRRGDTFGVFYLESPAMRLLMAKAGRGDFAHTVIHSSIIRPAANSFINEYVARLRGKEWRYEHPLLEGLFDESYGIPVYQEDVIKLAMALAGWDHARADGLRKSLGKRDARERLGEIFPDLAEAARERGVDDKTIRLFWNILMSMTGYSFCKPHSASYAQVSFESAYLRAHYPASFMAAVISNGGGYYSLQAYVSEAMRLGLAVLGPDVNASNGPWRAEGRRAIRAGLATVSGLSRSVVEAIVDSRGRRGRFAGLEDFLDRIRIPSDELHRLALVGGLDSLAPELNRPQLMWCAAQAARVPVPVSRRPAAAVTGSLFAPKGPPSLPAAVDLPEASARRLHPPDLPAHTDWQRWEAEYATLGFIPGRHPLVLYADRIGEGVRLRLRQKNPLLIRVDDLPRQIGKMVTILAWPITAKIVETRRGDAMMFQSFEDTRGLCEAVLFPEEFRRFHRLLDTAQPLWVTGRVEEEFDVATLRVVDVKTL